jgi:hypothetical protein
VIHPLFELIDVEGAIHVVHVVVEEIVGGLDGQDRLERRRLSMISIASSSSCSEYSRGGTVPSEEPVPRMSTVAMM